MSSLVNKLRTTGFLLLTLIWSITHEMLAPWAIFFAWGLLMALWEQPTHRWDVSIFKKWGWHIGGANMNEGWRRTTKLFGFNWVWDDMFHITKSLSIILMAASVFLLQNYSFTWLEAAGLGWVTTESFNYFYNYLLTIKNNKHS